MVDLSTMKNSLLKIVRKYWEKFSVEDSQEVLGKDHVELEGV